MNRTIPDESGRVHGWISEPSGRGTASVLYTCLITIFLCIWSAMHINIPERNKSKMENFFYKVEIAVLAIIAPEAVFTNAIIEYFFIREVLDELPASFSEVRMIYLSFLSPLSRRGFVLTDESLKGGLKFTEIHAWFIIMGGFELQCTDGTHRLSFAEIKDLITKKAIPVSSIAIAEEEISDRSKTDRLSKLIACLQILWFVIQLIGRAVQHLPTTNLELFTLGIVVCSFGTYAAYWRRPQDIGLPITISVDEGKTFRDIFGKPISLRRRFSWNSIVSSENIIPFFSSGIITAIFGTCHLIGWDFLYPSSVEQLLWRIASISCVAIPFLLIFSFILVDDDIDFWPPQCSVKYLGTMSINILLPLYVLARVYLLVAIFISLRSVPAGVYQTVNWSLYFPHF
ncbi:hypothetical protein V8E54_006684 [Elaphomyces granulatus]